MPKDIVKTSLAPRCLSIDLEVGLRDGRIHRFAGVRGDTGERCVFEHGDIDAALRQLDALADGAAFVLGHNLDAFDLPRLRAASPALQLLSLPTVDTLRLSPLAFPRAPYHHLVKHYQDGALRRGGVNDPEKDALQTLALLGEQLDALKATAIQSPALVLAWHWLTTSSEVLSGLNACFLTVRRAARPNPQQAAQAIAQLLSGTTCRGQADALLAGLGQHGWPLAYALAWLAVSGSDSVMPPWVRHQFPEAGALVRRLRDTACDDPGCAWCRQRHDARRELTRWFGYTQFRAEPAGLDGKSLQQAIVEAALQGRHALGILPTGAGKSLCYQLPALSRYDKTGALTVVISPLVALMADQVAGLQARGITCCAALTSLLSMPERASVLERLRLGAIGIVLIAPEQLRNHAVRKALAQREIGAWVLDEAHCLSKWGHDFRPDYRYVGRFIRHHAGLVTGTVAPVLCLTATARPEVVTDLLNYFRDQVGIELAVFDGGAQRDNLRFEVVAASQADKLPQIHQLLQSELLPDSRGGAIVYCASRRQTRDVAAYLGQKGMPADYFHAGLTPDARKSAQQRFLDGSVRVIAATNAFGMGIDKPDVRLVIHADLPASLENYLQEAGRAGRDQAGARCVLLYAGEDVERQFALSARGRLTQREIQVVLKALKRLDRKKKLGGEVIATTGEILAEDGDAAFARDAYTDDTRVRTALGWLEEAGLLRRAENQVQVLPSSLRVTTFEAARQKLAAARLFAGYQGQLLALVQALFDADTDQGISTDELMGITGLEPHQVRAALYDLEKLGIASNDTAITAFVHAGIERASPKRLLETAALEAAFIDALRQAAPDLQKGDSTLLHLRQATQHLKDAGHGDALPETLARIVAGLANDGRDGDGASGSIGVKKIDAETLQITLGRDWAALEKTASLRRSAGALLLQHWLACLPAGTRGADLLAATTLGKLLAALEADLALMSDVRDSGKLLDRALLWLHEQQIIRLNKGLAVFRPAMTIRLNGERRGFTKADFAPLRRHYDEQVVHIHIMAEYARRGLDDIDGAQRLAHDYFRLERGAFLQRWMARHDSRELARQTTPASWHAIVEALNNPVQEKIVADEREQTNVLVLAGPGSGKTRVLVHRIAYLIRVRRENPRAILALTYNRHAAVEIRRRLADLIGDDARGVVVLTCHAFAMRLTGTSFKGRSAVDDGASLSQMMQQVLRQAVALLKGDEREPDEADDRRDALLASFRSILVDEYQDIGPDQYELIAALAGRSRSEDDGKLSLFAVGDDDQNIYAFDGASVEFIRRFESEYDAKPAYLVENYRSTRHIIDTANYIIEPAQHRMKAQHPVSVDAARSGLDAGGDWLGIDSIGRGRVQVLPAGRDDVSQAQAVMTELQRLAGLAPRWDWTRCAVIARDWKALEPLRNYCELNGVPVQMANEETGYFWRLRETRLLVDWLRGHGQQLLGPDAIDGWLAAQPAGRYIDMLREAAADYGLEHGGAELPAGHCIEWLVEWGREMRRRQTGLLLLTAHRAKGLEFEHVAVLDGEWQRVARGEDGDAPRRLLYVAMTRARKTLTMARFDVGRRMVDAITGLPSVLYRRAAPPPRGGLPTPYLRQYLRLGMRDVNLGFAGRIAATHPTHKAIAALTPGAALTLRQSAHHWELLDGAGVLVGQLAQAFEVPSGMHCVSASVAAIVVQQKSDSEHKYQALLRCERWEVVLPELIFEPE